MWLRTEISISRKALVLTKITRGYCQTEGISYAFEAKPHGSGAIKSTVKQIGQPIQIAGAQWEKDNIPQGLKQRYAYLNGRLSK